MSIGRKISKLWLNVQPGYIAVIGLGAYARLLGNLILNLPAIVSRSDMRVLDKAMGRKPIPVHFQGRRFTIDCPTIDQKVEEDTYTFGIMRELLMRNCYVRHGVADALKKAKYVLDLGANRGVFTVMAAAGAEKVVSVEGLDVMADAARHNAAYNGFNHVFVECAFIGGETELDQSDGRKISFEQIMQKYDLPSFDVIKMDIEGSEYALFETPEWLDHCGALCMEVHPQHGRVAVIVDTLKSRGFTVETANQTFQRVSDLQDAEFIWAWKTGR